MKRKLMIKGYDMYSKLVRFISFKGFALLPPLIIWEPTYRCNLRCKMCPFYGLGGTIPSFKDEMTLDQIKKVFNNIKKSYSLFLPRIHITGGEPLLHKHFPEIVVYLKKLGFNYSITSNFTFLNRQILNTLKKYPPLDLRISLDGPAEIHDRIRGFKGIFSKVMKNLETLRESNISTQLRFNCTISNDNLDHLDKMVDIAKKNKTHINFQHLIFLNDKHIKKHYLFFEKVFGCKTYPICSKGKMGAEEAEKIIIKIKKIKKMSYNVTFLPDLNIGEIRNYYLDLDNYVHSSYCSSVWSETRIAPNGKMYPCFDYYFGDLRISSFSDVWNGEKARRFRRILKKRKLFPGCVRCCKI